MTFPRRPLLVCATALAGSAVVAGAFGAHALADMLSPGSLSSWRTAVTYQMWHALALFVVVLLAQQQPSAALRNGGIAFVVGVLLFSGSLYVLALGGPRWLGPVTPVGGLAMMVGWVALLVHVATARHE